MSASTSNPGGYQGAAAAPAARDRTSTISWREAAAGLTPREDRAAGAVVGALVGDALGVGPHWYYDLDEMRKDHGDDIRGYRPVLPGRYHQGVELGDVSQTGQFAQLLLESVAERGGYDEGDYAARLDTLLDTLDGTPYSGRYTDEAVRHVWAGRKRRGLEWGAPGCAGFSDSSEAAVRSVVLAARLAGDPMALGQAAMRNARLTHADTQVVASSTAFACVLGALVRGRPLDGKLGWHLRELVREGRLPFTHADLAEELGEGRDAAAPPRADLPFPDALLQAGWAAEAAADPDIVVPPTKLPLLLGRACSIGFLLPAAYYLAARYPRWDDAVFGAVNGGGQNMARAALTGAVSGAVHGLSAIPPALLDGLKDADKWVRLAVEVARAAAAADDDDE